VDVGHPTQPKAGLSAPCPVAEYRRRLEERRQRAAVLARQERLVGNTRLVVFLAALAIAWLAFGAHRLSGWWLAAPIAAYGVLLVVHEQLTRAWYRARRATSFYEAGLARLADHWRGRGQNGARFLSESHPYAADLDLFGPGSLFELLCTARTRTGEDTLAAWLMSAAAPPEVRARQEAVAELRPLLDLREDLALLGSEVPVGVDFEAVAAWGEQAQVLPAGWLRWVVAAVGLTTTTALVGWLLALVQVLDPDGPLGFFYRVGSIPFDLVLLVQLALAAWLAGRVRRVLEAVEKRARDLALLSSVLARLERASFTSPRLAGLRATLDTPPQSLADSVSAGRRVPPSQRIAQLGNLLDLLDSRRNQMFAPLAYLLMWGTQMAFAIEKWRRVAGPAVRRWLAVVGEFEALCSLAAYAYENPDDVFPEILEAGPCYDGEGLGHPLLPADRCVRNDLRLDDRLRVLVVSGSNMSGKSTFLRTVGVSAVLALAGRAPAPAAVAAGGRRHAAHPGLAAGGAVAVLRGDPAGTPGGRSDARADPALVPARRNLRGYQLTRPAPGGRVRGQRSGPRRRHRPGDHARPVPDPHRRRPGGPGRQRPLRRPLRKRRHDLRLPPAARRRPAQQRPGLNACRGTGRARGRIVTLVSPWFPSSAWEPCLPKLCFGLGSP
jgi:hypothetical protein